MSRRAATSVLGLAALVLCAGVLSFTIQRELYRGQSVMSLEDALYRLIGSAKEAIGDTLFLKADSYFHGGAEIDLQEGHDNLEKEGVIEEKPETVRAPMDWIAEVNTRVKSHEHRHLTRPEQKEMLPFFALATQLDPHNVEAILTVAFWLDKHLDKTDAATEVLEKGIRDNPAEWRIDYDLARIEFAKKHDYAFSERLYRSALVKIGAQKVESYYLIDIYYYLAESCLQQGKKAQALEAYRKVLGLFGPADSAALRKTVLEKIKGLDLQIH